MDGAWKGTGKELGSAGYYAVALDARGHGDSDWDPHGVYSQDVMVEDLIQVITALEGRRPVLVGASMGGAPASSPLARIASTPPRWVLVDIAPRIEPEGVHKIQTFMNQSPDGFASLEDVADAIASYQPHRQRPLNLDGLAKNVRLGHDGRYHWHWDPRFRSGHRDMEQRQERLEACAKGLTLPTLLVRGGMSDLLTEQGAQDFLTLCAHAEYVNVPGAAHMVAGDRNDVFATSVIDFLARTVPANGEPIQPPHEPRPRPWGDDIIDVP